MAVLAPSPATGGAATREGLAATAERLFGDYGVNGVSLRLISKEAKCGNVVAVQYHFGDKVGLLKAIFERRMPGLEAMRREMLDRAGENASVRQLVEVLFRPLAEIADDNGRLTFARFLLQHSLHPEHRSQIGHPIPSIYDFREPRTQDGPTATALVRLGQALPHVPMRVLMGRITHLLRMFLGALIDHEDAVVHGLEAGPLDRLVEDQVAMIAAALATPTV